MPAIKPLPALWLLSDARNDATLEQALASLPAASGFVLRHYHLAPPQRAQAFRHFAALARGSGHVAVLAGTRAEAEALGADGIYGPAARLGPPGAMLRLATAHDGDELQAANAARVDAVFLSPVFPTRSHPGAGTLGALGFGVLAQQARVPVIALGGMTAARALEIGWPRWAAIDGLG